MSLGATPGSFGSQDGSQPPTQQWDDLARFDDDIRMAMTDGELHVAFQPIVELDGGRLRKVEALCRWTHPTLGEISPAQFIPLAEQSGIIDELGDWVLSESCAALGRFAAAGLDVGLSVNLSVVQLRQPAIAERVAAILEHHGIDPTRLWVEVTESVLLEDAALQPLIDIRTLGCHLVIDDFGTGYATFQYLTRLPIDSLKIDLTFISGLGVDVSDTAIVRSVINLGRELGLEVVAEGVETESQRAQLAMLHCRLGQGWLFSRAVECTALIELYRHQIGRQQTSLAPLPGDEAARVAALRACRVLDTSHEEAFDALVALASELLATPMALITLIDVDRQWFKARVGVDATESPRDLSICSHAIAVPGEPFIVADTAVDERFAANPFVTGDPKIASYAGVPICSREGLALGTLCVLDTTPRSFTPDQISRLTMLAEQAAALLDLRRRAHELSDLLRTRSAPGAEGPRAPAIDRNLTASSIAAGAQAVREGASHGEFVLYYEPVVPLQDRSAVAAVTVQVRWLRPTGGVRDAEEVAHDVARVGAEVALARFAIPAAYLQVERWRRGGQTVPLTIDLETKLLTDPEYCSILEPILLRINASDGACWLEASAADLVHANDGDIDVLRAWVAAGADVMVSVDHETIDHIDMSTLESRTPISGLKLIMPMPAALDAVAMANLVRRAVACASHLDVPPYASGVTDERQHDELSRAGFSYGQGPLYGDPSLGEHLLQASADNSVRPARLAIITI